MRWSFYLVTCLPLLRNHSFQIPKGSLRSQVSSFKASEVFHYRSMPALKARCRITATLYTLSFMTKLCRGRRTRSNAIGSQNEDRRKSTAEGQRKEPKNPYSAAASHALPYPPHSSSMQISSLPTSLSKVDLSLFLFKSWLANKEIT